MTLSIAITNETLLHEGLRHTLVELEKSFGVDNITDSIRVLGMIPWVEASDLKLVRSAGCCLYKLLSREIAIDYNSCVWVEQ